MRTGVVLAIALVVWQLCAGPLLPGPAHVLGRALELALDGPLLADLWASVRRVATGYAFASVAALVLGAAVATAGRWGEAVLRVIELLRPIPPIAWVPLSILWFGLGDRSAWSIVFVGAFFPIFANVAWALSRCPPAYLELARSLGASTRLTLWRVRLPAAAPAIAAGLRTSRAGWRSAWRWCAR